MLHVRTVHSDQSYEMLWIQIIHAPYGFKQFAREINRGRELFLNFSRGCANYSKFGGARNYSRACNIRVIRVYIIYVTVYFLSPDSLQGPTFCKCQPSIYLWQITVLLSMLLSVICWANRYNNRYRLAVLVSLTATLPDTWG